ncbi:uncharacterized protein C21orf62-like [Gadus chalcogrammus]|uniref:uncharacterized protein C21orf62-like n=1 Tax=Gadus chalcogrammus TaxID=1042646 RepID=UPI0024C4CECC|nr:uncharacterized protein C21orf62-like [Gadus chalcogrammus]
MSLNKISSALLPWFLCLSFLPSRIAWTTESTPTSAAVTPVSAVATEPAIINNNNNMLFFQDSVPGGGLRYCSCPAPVLHCDETLAELQCSCRSVSPTALPPAGLSEPRVLVTVWLRDTGLLQDLLNGSRVSHLQLVSCGGKPLNSQHLALLGLLTLKIHSSAQGAPYPDQELSIVMPAARVLSSSSSVEELEEEEGAGRGVPPPLRLTFLDVALLNGLSALKAYSVTGQSLSSLETQFPRLPLALLLQSAATPTPGDSTGSHDQVRDPDGEWVLTFVY